MRKYFLDALRGNLSLLETLIVVPTFIALPAASLSYLVQAWIAMVLNALNAIPVIYLALGYVLQAFRILLVVLVIWGVLITIVRLIKRTQSLLPAEADCPPQYMLQHLYGHHGFFQSLLINAFLINGVLFIAAHIVVLLWIAVFGNLLSLGPIAAFYDLLRWTLIIMIGVWAWVGFGVSILRVGDDIMKSLGTEKA